MHSSTSNSNNRLAIHDWAKAWFLCLVLAIGMVSGMEWFWRDIGHRPSVVDDEELWSVQRCIASSGSPNVVALIGASRLQTGFDPQVFVQAYPRYRVANLVIRGKAPIATLRDLARDRRFRGLAICSIEAGHLRFGGWESQESYVQHYHQVSRPDTRLVRWLHSQLQARLVVLRPELRIKDVILNTPQWGWTPSYMQTRPDRYRALDYTRSDLPTLTLHRIDQARAGLKSAVEANQTSPDTEWFQAVQQIEQMVQQIQRRKGRVVFIRMPTTGEYGKIFDRRIPKQLFWDAFAQRTSAQTVHFKDVPSLRDFHCPEGSHLDYRDAPRFTLALAAELEKRGVIQK